MSRTISQTRLLVSLKKLLLFVVIIIVVMSFLFGLNKFNTINQEIEAMRKKNIGLRENADLFELKYNDLRDQLDFAQLRHLQYSNYMENSILATMNPLELETYQIISSLTLPFEETDKVEEFLYGLIKDKSFVDELRPFFKSGTEDSYISELIEINYYPKASLLSTQVYTGEETQPELLARRVNRLLTNKLIQLFPDAESSYNIVDEYPKTIESKEIEEKIRTYNEQNGIWQRKVQSIQNSIENLLDNEQPLPDGSFTRKNWISIFLYAVIGAFVGTALSILLILLYSFITAGKYTPLDFQYETSLPVLFTMKQNSKSKTSIFDGGAEAAYIEKNDDVIEFLAYSYGNEKVGLIGEISTLEEKLPSNFTYLGEDLDNSVIKAKRMSIDRIVFALNLNKITKKEIRSFINQCEVLGTEIAGVILT